MSAGRRSGDFEYPLGPCGAGVPGGSLPAAVLTRQGYILMGEIDGMPTQSTALG